MQPSFGPKIVPASFPGTDQQQMMGIERQRALAQALMSQSMSPLETPQSGGRIASPVSPLAGVAKALQAVAGVYGQKKADERTAGLVEALRGRQNTALQRIAEGPQVNAPGGVTQPPAPATPGDITMGAPGNTASTPPNTAPTPPATPQAPTYQQHMDGLQEQENQAFADLNAGKINPSQFEGRMSEINDQRMIVPQPLQLDTQVNAPDVGIVAKTPRPESATEFAVRVRIIANQLNLDPQMLMAMPEVGGRYQQLLEMEKEGRAFGRDIEKMDYQSQIAREQKKYERDLTANDIVGREKGPSGDVIGFNRAGQSTPLGNVGADMNHLMIPDGKGGWMVNEKLASAQEAIRRAGKTDITVGDRYETQRSKDQAKAVSEAQTAAEAAYNNATQIRSIVDILKPYQGGRLGEWGAALGQYMPAGTDLAKMSDAAMVAESIRTRMAPSMRPAGSGSTSDFEMKAFMSSIPSLINRPEGRELIARVAERMAERAAFGADLKDELAAQGRYSLKAYTEGMKAKFGDKFLSNDELAIINGGAVKPTPKSGSSWQIEKVE